jgi:hypothetical protein
MLDSLAERAGRNIARKAINLAPDAALRFPGMPGIATATGSRQGSTRPGPSACCASDCASAARTTAIFPARNSMWETAEKTAHDALHRMALVPRVLQAASRALLGARPIPLNLTRLPKRSVIVGGWLLVKDAR